MIPGALSSQDVSWSRVAPDVLAFAIGLGAAWFLGWKTTDLVWSLWLSSLCLGYLTILSTIGAGVYIGVKLITHPEFPKDKTLPVVLIGTGVALFLLGFFSLHFCGFHAAHASVLADFFPLPGLDHRLFFDAFENPFALWAVVFKHLMRPYGIFLVPAIIAERRYVFRALVKAVRMVREGGVDKAAPAHVTQKHRALKEGVDEPFFRPYLNVIRMHLLIFFFAFCYFLKINSFFVYTVVYFVYFFPWRILRTEDKGAAMTVR